MSNFNPVTRIKVFGVGGGGCNAVNRMVEANLAGVDFYVANTDLQVLSSSNCANKIMLGANTTHGLGAGGNPAIGKEAALESVDEIRQAMQDADMIFIATGLGGGTGTGAAPIFCQCAKESGALTIAICTKPFDFEGKKRMMQAINGLDEIKTNVDSLIIIPNEKVHDILGALPFTQAFMEADNVLRQSVQTITDLVSYNAFINLDFADVKATMSNQGIALIGVGQASAAEMDSKDPVEMAKEAARRAINCPLLEADISGAKNAIINITGGSSLSIDSANAAVSCIKEAAGNDVDIIFGIALNNALNDSIIVTVIATGFEIQDDGTVVEAPKTVQSTQTTTAQKVDEVDIPDFIKFRHE